MAARTVQPFRIDKITTDPRFEELQPPEIVEDSLQVHDEVQGEQQGEHTLSCARSY